MSINDLVTAIIALAAVLVPFAALLISDAVDKRSARSTLTDLAVKVNDMATSYAKLQSETGSTKAAEDYARTKGTDDLYTLCTEIEMLVGQADFLVSRLEPGWFIRWIPSLARRPRYAWSIPVTLAQTLESTDDPWWADQYWEKSVRAEDQHVRAWAFCYWTMALCNRGEYKRAGEKITEGLKDFTSPAASERIFRGEIYAALIPYEPSDSKCWSDKALQEYDLVSEEDELYRTAQDRIARVRVLLAGATQSS